MQKNRKSIHATVVSLLLLTSTALGGQLVPVDVSEFCVTPEQNVVLHWKTSENMTPEQLAFVISDVNAKPVSTGTAQIDGDIVSADMTLPQGYWEIAFEATDDRFGVIALPAAQQPFDAFFAIDAALSWLVKGDDLREGIIKLGKRSGIGMMRERFRLKGVAPEEGRFDFETQNRYDTLRNAYQKHGIEVLELSHDAPEWMGCRKVYPKDLVQYADAMGTIAEKWQDGWGAIEIWNEPDIFFGGDLPADQYVAVVRAAAYRLRENGCKTPIIGGVMAQCNEDWIALAKSNKLHELIDIFSFHTYDRAPQIESLIEKYRNQLENLPLWLTECGRPWKKGPDRPPLEQDLESVTDIVMKGVESRCCGVARYFPFVLPYYEENDNNFGMLDRQGTPLRSMAGYAQLIRTLAHTEYVGDLQPDAFAVLGEDCPQVLRARVFQKPDNASVIVLYTGNMNPTMIKTNFPVQKAESVTGEICDSQTITNGLIYLYADLPENMINRDTQAMQLLTRSQEPRKDFKFRLSPFIPAYEYDEEAVTPTSAGYKIKNGRYKKVAFTIYNASQNDAFGEFYMPGGPYWHEESSIYLEAGQCKTIKDYCGPGGMFEWIDHSDIHYDIVCQGEADPVTFESIEKTGNFGGCFVVRMLREPDWKRLHKEFPNAKPLNVAAEHWQPSLAAHGKMNIENQSQDATDSNGPQNCVRFDVTFGEGDRWCYPRLSLPADLQLRKGGGIFAQIRCTGEIQPRVFLFEQSSGAGYLSNDGKMSCPDDGNWHTVHLPLRVFSHNSSTPPDSNGRLDLDEVKTISFGFNTKQEHVTLEIGDVFVY